MTLRLNSNRIENFFSVLRMHGDSYNRNPLAKIVRFAIRKNILLNLKNCLQRGNCMLDDDVPLMSRDYLEEPAAVNAS